MVLYFNLFQMTFKNIDKNYFSGFSDNPLVDGHISYVEKF